MQSGLRADAASLRGTGSVDRYTRRVPVAHSCGAVSHALADGAEGLHFRAI